MQQQNQIARDRMQEAISSDEIAQGILYLRQACPHSPNLDNVFAKKEGVLRKRKGLVRQSETMRVSL